MWPWKKAAEISLPQVEEGNPASFWAWFLENEETMAEDVSNMFASGTGSSEAGAKIHEALDQYGDGLCYEIGRLNDGRLDLVISADGLFDRFPSVIELVANAPRSQKFKFTAFRQRQSNCMLEMNGVRVSAEDCDYLIRSSAERPGKFDIVIFIDAPGASEKERWHVAYILLDSTIGEYDMETLIGAIDVEGKIAAQDLETKTLDKLPAELDELASRQGLH
jgi:hypothetical protein